MSRMETGMGWDYPPGTPGYYEEQQDLVCENGHVFEGIYWSELGTGGYKPEECPECGTVEIEEAT